VVVAKQAVGNPKRTAQEEDCSNRLLRDRDWVLGAGRLPPQAVTTSNIAKDNKGIKESDLIGVEIMVRYSQLQRVQVKSTFGPNEKTRALVVDDKNTHRSSLSQHYSFCFLK
jgi:hypothetical protein